MFTWVRPQEQCNQPYQCEDTVFSWVWLPQPHKQEVLSDVLMFAWIRLHRSCIDSYKIEKCQFTVGNSSLCGRLRVDVFKALVNSLNCLLILHKYSTAYSVSDCERKTASTKQVQPLQYIAVDYTACAAIVTACVTCLCLLPCW